MCSCVFYLRFIESCSWPALYSVERWDYFRMFLGVRYLVSYKTAAAIYLSTQRDVPDDKVYEHRCEPQISQIIMGWKICGTMRSLPNGVLPRSFPGDAKET